MIPNIGPLEIGIVLIIALLVFGPKRIPELGSSLGKGIRGFGSALKGDEEVMQDPPAPESEPAARVQGARSPARD